MNIAKLFVALGALDQASGGEMFWPGHGGLVRDGSEPANLDGHTSPSLNAGEVNANGPAVGAAPACTVAATRCEVGMDVVAPFLLDATFWWAPGAAERRASDSAAQPLNVAAHRAINNIDAEDAKKLFCRKWNSVEIACPPSNPPKTKTIRTMKSSRHSEACNFEKQLPILDEVGRAGW